MRCGMKNKYQRMTKEEKKQCQLFYYRTEKGRDMRKRLIRLLIIGIAGLLFAAFMVISAYLIEALDWETWAMAGILVFFSIVFIVGSLHLRLKCLNQYAVTKMG